jgi:ATP-dependent exoDNAse (exonuclease V) alpha subunit
MVSVGNETLWKGDRVLCTKRSRMFGVENGDTGTIMRANPTGSLLTIQLDRGRTVLLPAEQYPDIRLGYAMTTHKGQGATVEKAYVLFGGGMQDREITYVQASRARGETRLYTDVFEAGEKLQGLVAQTARSGAKTLAHDVPAAVQEVVEPVLRLTITQ